VSAEKPDSPQVAAARIEAARARSKLMGTAHELQERISPKTLTREAWDLVLLDLSLPDRSGFETLRHIRRLRPGVPVLVMSFNVQAEYAAATRAAGAVGYIAKGSSSDAIASAVRGALAAPLQK